MQRLQSSFFDCSQSIRLKFITSIFLLKNLSDISKLLVILRYFGRPLHHKISILLHIKHFLDILAQGSNFMLFASQLIEIFE
jgi:hypothetical protein